MCCFVLLTDIGESLRSRGQFLSALTWGGRILTLHLNYVAGYIGPLLFLFERGTRVCVALFYYTDIGESLRSRGQFLTVVDLGWPDPHPAP